MPQTLDQYWSPLVFLVKTLISSSLHFTFLQLVTFVCNVVLVDVIFGQIIYSSMSLDTCFRIQVLGAIYELKARSLKDFSPRIFR